MIIFKKIKFKNFGSFGNTWTEVDLNKNTTTLVCGTNGSGKSFALLDSITFALFGKPFRKINLTQLNNSINKKECLVELEFSVDKTEYKIIRGLSPKIFEIYKDGILLNQEAKKTDYQDILEEQIIRMNYKTFTQVVILGSSSFVPFMQLPAADRRAVIENILDINIFTTMNVVLKTKLTIAKENIADIENKIQMQQQRIEYQQKIVDNLKTAMKKDVIRSKEEIEILENSNKELFSNIETLEKEKESLESLLSNDIDQIKKKIKDSEKLITQSSYKISELEKEIEFYNKNDSCPRCKSTLTKELKNENINDLNEIMITFVENTNKAEKLKDKNRKIEEEYDTHMSSIRDLEEKIKYIRWEIKSNNEKIEYKRRDLDESNKIQTDLDKETALLKREKQIFADIEKEKTDLKEDYSYLKLAGDILKDNGVKIKIIKHYLPAMNKYINKYLKAMDFFVQFHIDEEFKEIIKSRHRDEFSYMNFSEGEKMRIDLALLLSWREIARIKNSVNCNLLILDEIFDSSLDSVGIDEVLKLLNALGVKNNVFVISHKADQIVDKFKNTISFEKKNNFSRLASS